jgi:cytochrome c2
MTRCTPFVVITALLLSACGTLAEVEPIFTPTPTQPPATAVPETDSEAGAPAPTATPIPPTATPEPPTATPVPPTAVPTEAPTEAAAEAPSGAPAVIGTDPISVLVSIADPARGEELFYASYDTNAGPYACFTCHNVENEERKIGPGQYGIADRAGTRIEGQSAAQYLYNSIIHPNDYIVAEYEPNLMPGNYSELLSEQDIYDIVAYLFTLR